MKCSSIHMVGPVFSVDPGKCTGCKICDVICSLEKTGLVDLGRSCIKTTLGPEGEVRGPVVCLHCDDPECSKVCPTGAIARDPSSGIVVVEESRCVGCLLCTLACPYGGVFPDPATGKVYKCDLCGGTASCLPFCEPEALDYANMSEVYGGLSGQEDLLSPGLSFCPGCSVELSLRTALRIMGKNTIISVAPSCMAATGMAGLQDATGSKVPVFFPLLTNSASMMAGVKRSFQRRGVEVHAVAIAGDGGTADVGFQSLSGAAERGENIIYLCLNNEGYMNTGIQRSGTTPLGAWTTTTPVGKIQRGKAQPPKYMPLLMALHNVPYVATLNPAYLDDFVAKVEKAKKIRDGLVYLEVFTPCPVGWRHSSARTLEVARLATQTGFWPLWEADHGAFRITVPVEHRRPVQDYLESMGKYAHLLPLEIRAIQMKVDKELALLRKLVGPDTFVSQEEKKAPRSGT